jgi:molybdopterin converting factor small subunit
MACVRFWAGARALAGTAEQVVVGATLHELLEALRHEYGEKMTRLLDASVILLDGGQVDTKRDRPLADSAVVEILPPYAGG